MCRNLALAATALALVLAAPGLAAAKSKDKAQESSAHATATPAPAPPHKTTADQRVQAERLEPLARAAFWAHELEVDPKDAQAGVRLSAALRSLGRTDEAAQAAQSVLVLDPSNRDALFELARAYIAAGNGFYAIEPLKRLQAANDKDWRPWSLIGVAFDQVQRPADAEAAWRQALVLSPNNPSVLSNLAMHDAAKGDTVQAETLLRQAAAQPGATVQIRQNLALILGLQGKLAEAETLARQDLPPEVADNNLAYLRAAHAAEAATAVRGAQTAGS